MRLSWTKNHRLTRRAEFLACYEHGERYHTRHFIVHARPGQFRARLGLTVSRKCGCAVERNRVKRVLREFFRLNQALLPNMDIVISPKRNLDPGRITLALVSTDLTPLMERLTARQAAGQDRPSPSLNGERA